MGVQSRRDGQKAGQMKFSLVCSGVLIAICMIDNTRSRFFRCFCPTVSDLVKYMDEAAARKEIRSCEEYCRAEREESDKKAQRLVTTRKLRCKAGDIIFCQNQKLKNQNTLGPLGTDGKTDGNARNMKRSGKSLTLDLGKQTWLMMMSMLNWRTLLVRLPKAGGAGRRIMEYPAHTQFTSN